MDEKVVILGADAVGICAALVLQKMGFAVELVDAAPDILWGNAHAAFVHQGDGIEAYARGDRSVGRFCIDASFVKGLIYPLELLRTRVCEQGNPIRFLAASPSRGTRNPLLDALYRNEEHMRAHFARRFEAVRSATGWSEERAAEIFLRHPRSFSRRLAPAEHADVVGVAGGCAGSSFGVNMPGCYAFLKAALAEAGVPFHPGTDVEAVEKSGPGYVVHAGGRAFRADYVLATGPRTPVLAARFHGASLDPAFAGVCLVKSMMLFRLPANSDPVARAALRHIDFLFQDETVLAFFCVVPPTATEEGLAAAYPPGESSPRRYPFDLDHPPPDGWDDAGAATLPSEDPRAEEVLRHLADPYPALAGHAEPVGALWRPLVHLRPTGAPRLFVSNADRRISLWMSPKWTNAELVALLAVDQVCRRLRNRGLPKRGKTRFGPAGLDAAAVAEDIHFRDVRPRAGDARHYAAQHGWPAGLRWAF